MAAAHPADAGPLYLTAIQNITRTTEQADDSSGSIGGELSRAVSGYAAACRAAPPDPVKLAAWLIDFQVTGPGWPELPIADFADALGPGGLTAYRERLAGASDSSGWAIRHLREEYLKVIAQDTDALVALYAEELPQAYRYVQIASTLRAAGRADDAIGWLRRGLTEADRPDSRIDELLAELLTETSAYTEAAGLRWRLFTGRPGPQSHRALLDAAERAGADVDGGARQDRPLIEPRGSSQAGFGPWPGGPNRSGAAGSMPEPRSLGRPAGSC